MKTNYTASLSRHRNFTEARLLQLKDFSSDKNFEFSSWGGREGGKFNIYGLDRSASQPFNYSTVRNNRDFT